MLLALGSSAAEAQKGPGQAGPTLQHVVVVREDLFIYDSKAQPVATVSGALSVANRTGWELIRKYFPTLGTISEGMGTGLHPGDPTDARFLGALPTKMFL